MHGPTAPACHAPLCTKRLHTVGRGIYWLWYLLEYSFYTVQYTLHNILFRDSDHGVANTPITYLPLPILPSLTSLEDVCQTPYAALPQAGTRAAPAPAHPAMHVLSQQCEAHRQHL